MQTDPRNQDHDAGTKLHTPPDRRDNKLERLGYRNNYDLYAAELAQRFEILTDWAIANWPRSEAPLMKSDFDGARKDIARILGPMLGDGESVSESAAESENTRQYVDVTPMPWP